MHLGIDLGTSNSAIAAYVDGDVRIFKTVDKGADVLPSVIYIDKRANKFYGHRAYEHSFRKRENAADGFKRQLGTSWKAEFKDSGVSMSAEECSANILRQLVAQADVESGGREVAGAVVTIPAAFNQMQIEATQRAANEAKIDRTALLQEPVAAAMAAVAASGDKNGQFLIYDIGGGTFDLALVQSLRGKINVIAHEGINALGGRDFDRLIVNSIVRPWLLKNFSLTPDFQKCNKYRTLIRLARMAAEQAKIELSAADEASIYIDDEYLGVKDDNGVDMFFEIPLARAEYEKLIADKIAETIELSHKILTDNGYTHEDVDRVVFIGGPSKTPVLREIVAREMGIPGDMKVDPMTAVAVGAAHFCESLDWNDETVGRKKSRNSKHMRGDAEMQYDYPARTSDDRARIRIKPSAETAQSGLEVEINSDEGWTSGRKKMSGNLTIEAPLNRGGENYFRVMVFAADGKLLEKSGIEFAVTRTAATADSLRLTNTIAVMIRDNDSGNAENVLHLIAEKGTPLPAEGIAADFRAARDLGDVSDILGVEFFEQPEKENKTPSEPNLFIGRCEITRDKFPPDAEIHKGTEIIVHWKISESQLMRFDIEIPSLGQTFNGEFYSSKVGELSYEGEEGNELVAGMLQNAWRELSKARKTSSPKDIAELRKLQTEIERQHAELESSSGEGEERRSIAEKIRAVRQKIAALRNAPQNRTATLRQELEEAIEKFDKDCRDETNAGTCSRFDELAENAREALQRGGENNSRDAKRMIDEMHQIYVRALLAQPAFIVRIFKIAAQRRHLALDKAYFDDSVARGEKLLAANDIHGLRGVVREIISNRLQMDEKNQTADLSKLADLMRR